MTLDNSPNSLRPHKNQNNRHKKFYYIAFCLCTIFFAILVYNIHIAPHKSETKEQKQSDITEPNQYTQDLVPAEGNGLATFLHKETKDSSDNRESKQQIIVTRGLPPELHYNEEQEQIRKLRTQEFLLALKAPIISKQFSHSQEENKKIVTHEVAKDNVWAVKDKRTRGHEFEIKTGSIIPAIMVTGINSDLAGNIIAQVSYNVYDSTTGNNLLIPQGTKLFGVYDSKVVFGQSRVLVAWNRVIFPDGSSLTLPSMNGTDMSGYSGFKDKVNNHSMRIFGSAILMSLITGGTSYAVDHANNDNSDENSLSSQMTASLAQQIGQTSTRLLEQNLSIKPTLEIRAGYQFNIVLTKDLVFESPYRSW